MSNPKVSHTSTGTLPKMSVEEFLAEQNEMVHCFYKGSSLTIPRDALAGTFKLLRQKGYQPELTTQQILDQMELISARISDAHAAKADLNDDANFKLYFGSGLASIQHLSIVWAMNVATLLHRKVIKNDENNGWLAFNVVAPKT